MREKKRRGRRNNKYDECSMKKRDLCTVGWWLVRVLSIGWCKVFSLYKGTHLGEVISKNVYSIKVAFLLLKKYEKRDKEKNIIFMKYTHSSLLVFEK